jgi:hypothetical protein
MASAAKIQASRLNGSKSRGPITRQGKKTSSLNALKHGLTAKTLVLSNEDHSLFEKLQPNYIDSIQPTSALELEIIQRMVTAEWRLRRVWSVGTALTDDMLQEEAENPELSTTAGDPTDNFFSESEPKPAARTNSQSPSHQQLAVPTEFPPQSEPKK